MTLSRIRPAQGILRSTTPIISFETAANSATGSNSAVLADFGFARRQPLSLILKQLASRIQEHLAVPFETREDAADGLAVCVFASAFLEESLEFAPERLRILRLSIQRGLDYTTMAGAVPLAESQDDVVMESLRELVVSYCLSDRHRSLTRDITLSTASGNSSSSPSRPTHSYVHLFRFSILEQYSNEIALSDPL